MKYEPMSRVKFEENLSSGRYDTLTSARRAVGKCAWSQADKDAARTSAAAYFGVEETATPEKKEKKESKVKAPKAEKPAKVAKPLLAQESAKQPMYPSAKETAKLQQLHLASTIIAAGAEAIRALAMAHTTDPSLDMSEMQGACNIIGLALSQLQDAVNGNTPKRAQETSDEPIDEPEPTKSNGRVALTEEEQREHEIFRRTRAAAIV